MVLGWRNYPQRLPLHATERGCFTLKLFEKVGILKQVVSTEKQVYNQFEP